MNTEKEKALASFNWLESQRLIFLGCFLVGATGMILIRSMGKDVIYAVLFAGLVMFFYVLMGATKKYLIRPDMLGDNTYYLGFLFTLVSLAYTLYKYSSNENEVEAIIQNFGIALSTTLIGLLGRAYFIQTNEDPAIFEKAVRISLTDQASSLIGETARIRTDLLTLRTSIKQTIEEGVKNSIDSMNQTFIESSAVYKQELEKNSKSLNEVLNENLSSFQNAIQSSNETIRDSNAILLLAINEFKEASSGLTVELQGYTERIQGIESVEDALSKNLIEPLNKFQGAVSLVEDRFKQSSIAISDFSEKSNQAGASLKNMSELGIKEFASEIISLKQTLVATVQDINNISNAFSNLAQGIESGAKEMPNELRKFQEEYQQSNAKIREAASQSQESLLALQKSLITIADKLIDGVKKYG